MDAFSFAFMIPNLFRRLFGEGALSASFIPVYSKLVKKDPEEAGRVAGAVGAILGLAVSVIVLIGIVATPALIPLIAQGFDPDRREMTIRLTRILFPGAGIFVISAWCLGILNTHGRFLLSYLAPVFWNLAMIGALLFAGPRQGERDMATTLAWASVVGAALQFLVQVPSTLRLDRYLRMSGGRSSPHVRTVLRNFGPAFVSRGVVQISSYIDNWLASFLPLGMVATFGYASAIVVLPVSLFGMSISAA
jgi:putative peptidoglycan lipid II flippase